MEMSSNQPGHFKREKQTMFNTIWNTAKKVWKGARSGIGHAVGGLGALVEMGAKVGQIAFEGIDTVLSYVVTKSIARTATQRASELMSMLQSAGRGVQNFGDWIAGNKSTGDFLKDVLSVFKSGQYTCDLIFPTMFIDNAEIGKADKGAVLVLKFDQPDGIKKKPLTENPVGYLIFDKLKAIECTYSKSYKYENFGNYSNELVLQHIPEPGQENKYIPNERMRIFFTSPDVYFERESTNKKWSLLSTFSYLSKRSYTRHNSLKDIETDDLLILYHSGGIKKAHNEGKEFGMIFPKAELTDIELMSMIPTEELKEGQHPGTFVRFTINI